MFDDIANIQMRNDTNILVPYYIMEHYARHVQQSPIFSDKFFSYICGCMIYKWDVIEHNFKYIIEYDDISIHKHDYNYPKITAGAVQVIRDGIVKGNL